jgi:pimeloyl-ACP methyl ester carboxylesterase
VIVTLPLPIGCAPVRRRQGGVWVWAREVTGGAAMKKIVSFDGAPIAYWTSGTGPALVLVHGTTADHTRWQALLPLLEPHITVYAMDRRGRGASGDAPDYALEYEAADVVAVVEAVAGATGGPVDVFGHSYGAQCTLEALLLTSAVRRAVLYEPGIVSTTPADWLDRMTALLTEGRREEVVVALLRDIAGLTEEQVEWVRADPSWAGRVAAAHTVVRETRAVDDYRFDPARLAAVTVPTLLLTGSQTDAHFAASTIRLAEALPGAQVVTLAGQGHVAMLAAPELLAADLLRFLQDR